MSIETEKKRLADFLVNQTAAPEARKKRAREHATTPSPADFAIQALKDHIAEPVRRRHVQTSPHCDRFRP